MDSQLIRKKYYLEVKTSTVGPLLSGHPLLNGHLEKTRFFPLMFTVKFTFIMWSPLLSGRGHQIKDPNVLFYCISPLLNGHLLSTEIHTTTLKRCGVSRNNKHVRPKSTEDKATMIYCSHATNSSFTNFRCSQPDEKLSPSNTYSHGISSPKPPPLFTLFALDDYFSTVRRSFKKLAYPCSH